MSGNEDIRDGCVQNLLVKAQFALFAYVCALVGDTQDAKDVLQEANLKILRVLSDYDASRPFMPWAKSIAYYEVLSYRTRKSRNRLTFADDSFFELIASDAGAILEEADQDMTCLERCMRKLSGVMREMVEARYIKGLEVKELARARKCSANAVSLLLFKARRSLAECIRGARLKGVSP
ncbi:MAG: sigma-70 family RNA polymerase sigma factor [Kiritimatiellae bacterium]|nr:sigma-70 family RNA polymerase sigma factor [Kiritimatiellia bacterium]